MSIEEYFKRLPSSQEKILPSPHGSLTLSVPSRAIVAANKEVTRVLQEQQRLTTAKQQGRYNKYSPKERAEIGKYAVQHGISSTRTVFSRKLGMKISNSTISCIKTAYEQERARKRERHEKDADVPVLPEKKRGRHVFLGEKLDEFVQKYVLKVRERGGAVNTTLVVAGAKGIVESLDRTRLVE